MKKNEKKQILQIFFRSCEKKVYVFDIIYKKRYINGNQLNQSFINNMKPQNKTKITDVAIAAGVSVATVANALNGTGRVSDAVAKKVRMLADEMHYIPNRVARQLKMAIPDSIGILINSSVEISWYSQLISCFDDILTENNYSMVLSISRGEFERIKKGIISFQGGRVGGIILGPLFSMEMYKSIQKILPTDIPVVFFNSMDGMECDHISIDLASGAEKVVDYLYSRNCRNIMYFNCPISAVNQGEHANTRYAGFLNGLRKNGLAEKNAVIVTNEVFNWQKSIKNLLKKESLPDAIFCHNDAVAIEVMNYFHSQNIRIPEDVSIVGFDDIREARVAYPPLTTVGGVQQPLVKALWEALEERIKTGNREKRINRLIEPELIIRNSVK